MNFFTAGGCPPLFIPRKNWQQVTEDNDISRILLGEGVEPSLAAQLGRAFRSLQKQGNQDELANYLAIEDWAAILTCGGSGGIREATRGVASVTALNPDDWDYQATGSVDSTTIQAAIDEVVAGPATNGRVILSEGVFAMGGAIDLSARITLEGQGPSTVLDFSGYNAPPVGLNIASGDDLAQVKNMSLLLDGGAQHGIRVNANLVQIGGVTFEGTDSGGETGIAIGTVNDVDKLAIFDCNFLQCGLVGISISPTGDVTSVRIHDNFIMGGSRGIDLVGGDRVQILDNRMTDFSQYAINVTSGSTVTRVLIEGNQIDLAAIGIRMDNPGTGQEFSIIGNYIDNISDDGIELGGAVERVYIAGNRIHGCASDAIELISGGGLNVNECYIVSNMLSGNTGAGVRITGAGSTGNIVVANDLNNNGAGLVDGGTGTVTLFPGGANGDNFP